MRQSFLLCSLILSFSAIAQKVTISGTAFDTTNGRNWVHIVVNDTLRKFRANKILNLDAYKKLTEDSTLNLFAKNDGKFQLTAHKSDSIYFQSFRHIQKVYSVADLLKMETVDIRLEPEICIPFVRCEDTVSSNFYIFVAQKVNLEYEPEPYYCDVITMDSRYKAQYKILKQVIGHYPTNTIHFTVFDHYGRPAFSKYEHVLLFVSEYCGKLYHQKYQYFDLYPTYDGQWASPGDPYKYDSHYRKNLMAQQIQFADSVWFDISKLSAAAIKQQYPEQFYKIDGQKAIPIKGSYIVDLLTVKKEGVLKASKINLDENLQ